MDKSTTGWQAVFFDFDGVIADSTAVKVRAFAALFAPYGPEVQDAVVRYHLQNGGMPRRDKIRHCYTAIVGQTIDAQTLEHQGQSFAEMVFDEVVAAPYIDGALSTLQSLKKRPTPCFVVSGTPEEEMRTIVDRKQLSSFFLEVHGSPRVKSEIVADILHRHQLQSDQCLFIGDALADYRAAQNNGLRFLGIVPLGQPSIFPETVTTSACVQLFAKQ
ncbi:MAG: HAD family hydrolase [Desulfobulbus sp.]|nr:HAD family hydrolase [Desulfobulbus sp.]